MVCMKKRFQRTPKNYDGTATTSKDLRDLLGPVLTNLNASFSAQKEEVFKAWSDIIGTNIAPLAIPVSFDKGILTIKVKSSTLYSLLCTRDKHKLLKELQERFSKATVQNIIFRVG